MNLGDRLRAWFSELWQHAASVPPLSFLLDLLDQFSGVLRGKPPDATRVAVDTLGAIPTPPTIALAMALSALSGKSTSPSVDALLSESQKMIQDPAGYLERKIAEAESPGGAIDQAARIVANLEGMIYGALRDAASQSETDPLKLLVVVQTATMALKLVTHAVGVSAEILGLGQIETLDGALSDILNLAGLGEIGALAAEPIFTAGISPAAHRFYARQFRPRRLGVNELALLLRYDVIGEDTFRDEAAREGWRDEDMQRVIQLQRVRITPEIAQAMRDIGMIDDGELFRRMTHFRYTDEDAARVMELRARERHLEWSERLFTIALRLFAKYQIDVERLKGVARAAGFSQERIDVEISVATALRQAERTELSVGQIKSAYDANVLSEVEVATYLSKIQIDASGIPILLATWRNEKTRGGTHLNAQKLTEALRVGLISSEEMGEKLRALGWNSEDARLLVKMAEWQKPEKPRELSEGMIASAFADEVLTHDEALARLQQLKFSEEDARLILKMHTLRPAARRRDLTPAQIAKLVVLDAMSLDEALGRFVSAGYSQEDAELLFIAETEKIPAPVKSTGAPSQRR